MNQQGWFPDPTGRHEHRWWNGERWTDRVADRGVTSQDPFPPLDGDPAAPATRARRTRAAVITAATLVVGGLVVLAVVLLTTESDEATSAECDLVTTDELEAAVGVAFGPGEPVRDGETPGCRWESTAPPAEGLPGPLNVEIHGFDLTPGERAEFEEAASEPPNEPVPIGDMAFVACDIEADVGPGCDAYGDVFVAVGDRYLQVSLGNYRWPDDLTQEEVLDALVEVGSAAVDRAG